MGCITIHILHNRMQYSWDILQVWTCRCHNSTLFQHQEDFMTWKRFPHYIGGLTHFPVDKMAAVSQMTSWNAFYLNEQFVFRFNFHGSLLQRVQLTISQHSHWSQDKMATIFWTTVSNVFSWMKMHEFRMSFHQSLFLRDQLTIFHYWFR